MAVEIIEDFVERECRKLAVGKSLEGIYLTLPSSWMSPLAPQQTREFEIARVPGKDEGIGVRYLVT